MFDFTYLIMAVMVTAILYCVFKTVIAVFGAMKRSKTEAESYWRSSYIHYMAALFVFLAAKFMLTIMR